MVKLALSALISLMFASAAIAAPATDASGAAPKTHVKKKRQAVHVAAPMPASAWSSA
jgi:D-alanyl-D-alanine endopeptidase (penicillin-binding protein 7)